MMQTYEIIDNETGDTMRAQFDAPPTDQQIADALAGRRTGNGSALAEFQAWQNRPGHEAAMYTGGESPDWSSIVNSPEDQARWATSSGAYDKAEKQWLSDTSLGGSDPNTALGMDAERIRSGYYFPAVKDIPWYDRYRKAKAEHEALRAELYQKRSAEHARQLDEWYNAKKAALDVRKKAFEDNPPWISASRDPALVAKVRQQIDDDLARELAIRRGTPAGIPGVGVRTGPTPAPAATFVPITPAPAPLATSARPRAPKDYDILNEYYLNTRPAPTTPPPSVNRPAIQNPDGTVSTVLSIGVGDERGEWVIPTIVNGQKLTNDEATRLWKAGQNPPLGGPFRTIEESNRFAEQFHNQEAQRIGTSARKPVTVTPGAAVPQSFWSPQPTSVNVPSPSASRALSPGVPVPSSFWSQPISADAPMPQQRQPPPFEWSAGWPSADVRPPMPPTRAAAVPWRSPPPISATPGVTIDIEKLRSSPFITDRMKARRILEITGNNPELVNGKDLQVLIKSLREQLNSPYLSERMEAKDKLGKVEAIASLHD